jgi:phosphoglycolate phosphatase-like HAD superfamily hydrolase
MMGAETKAVLFDLDGTLIDSAPDLGAAADKMRTDRGLASYPLERYRPMAGAGARGMLGVAFGITPESAEFDALREEFFVTYEHRMLLNTQVFDGIPALIERAARTGPSVGRGHQQVDALHRSADARDSAVRQCGRCSQRRYHAVFEAAS